MFRVCSFPFGIHNSRRLLLGRCCCFDWHLNLIIIISS
jgi:hypothetical protein